MVNSLGESSNLIEIYQERHDLFVLLNIYIINPEMGGYSFLTLIR